MAVLEYVPVLVYCMKVKTWMSYVIGDPNCTCITNGYTVEVYVVPG